MSLAGSGRSSARAGGRCRRVPFWYIFGVFFWCCVSRRGLLTWSGGGAVVLFVCLSFPESPIKVLAAAPRSAPPGTALMCAKVRLWVHARHLRLCYSCSFGLRSGRKRLFACAQGEFDAQSTGETDRADVMSTTSLLGRTPGCSCRFLPLSSAVRAPVTRSFCCCPH